MKFQTILHLYKFELKKNVTALVRKGTPLPLLTSPGWPPPGWWRMRALSTSWCTPWPVNTKPVVNTRQAVNSQAADLADGAAAELLGELVLGELQREVDQQQQQLRHGQRGQEHSRVNVVSPGHNTSAVLLPSFTVPSSLIKLPISYDLCGELSQFTFT